MKILLKAWRIKRAWSQQELAQKSGVTQSMISEIESGIVTDPRLSTMRRLCGALRCMIEDMIEEDNPSHD